MNELRSLLERNALDEIAITLPLSQYEKLQGIVSICEKSGVHTKFIPDYYGVIPTIPYMEDVAGMPVINIRHVPLTEFYNAAAKRLVDIVGGIVGLIVFSPIMLLAAILVKISSPGPIIFKQERVGLHQKNFGCISSAPCACRSMRRKRRAGRSRQTRVSPGSDAFFEKQVLTRRHNSLILCGEI